MPTFLLKTPDENEVIGAISKDWSGGLPFTVLYDEMGKLVYDRQGIIKPEVLRQKIDALLTDDSLARLHEDIRLKFKLKDQLELVEDPYQKGADDAKKDTDEGVYEYIRIGPPIQSVIESDKKLAAEHHIRFRDFGCKLTIKMNKYVEGYNTIAERVIKQKFDVDLP